MNSSYDTKDLSYKNLLETVCFCVKPCRILEIGILDGFSLKTMADMKCNVEAYDIFDKFNGNHANSHIIDEFKNYENVKIQEGDFYSVYKNISDHGFDIIHVDIANDGDVYEFAMQHYLPKLTENGILIMEGGSSDRDSVYWMEKYNKTLINPILCVAEEKYNVAIKVFGNFPSITLIKKL